MPDESLSAALAREHREIDDGIETFAARLDGGAAPETLTPVLEALRRHIYLEEVFLFPPIYTGGLVMALSVMLRQHGELWQTIDELAELVANGADAERLRQACRRLLEQLEAHNAKEEPVIYPHADSGLTPQAGAELAAFIEAGRMPPGWVCRHGPATGD